ncbi:MAG TPA: virulence protein RhuM/Fic/DOC family protein [Bacteroidales bacterium]|nr:virulence protein RhuM/Fic/DOC family protein [Bacteroidales bacterium]
MKNKIEIFKTADNKIELQVQMDADTVWLSRSQMSELFGRDRTVISRHISNIFKENELDKSVVCAKIAHTTQHGAIKGKKQVSETEFYNLDVIISVGYRVKSQRGTQFRQWATQRLKDYLVEGYAVNEKRLEQKQQEVEYLKTGIRILNRAMDEQTTAEEFEMLKVFAKGLSLLDDYDHELLDKKGITQQQTNYPSVEEYLKMIQVMYSEIDSELFAKPKDESFHSSVNQIKQSFGDTELYPTIEEKAANLLYFITKNHSFVDGNKRIAAACFLYFMEQNKALLKPDGTSIIDNAALAALTLFIATSKPEEAGIVKQLTISILNRNK